MKYKILNSLSVTIQCLAAVAVTFGAWTAGFLIIHKEYNLNTLFYVTAGVSFGLLFIAAVINMILNRTITPKPVKKYEDDDFSESGDDAEDPFRGAASDNDLPSQLDFFETEDEDDKTEGDNADIPESDSEDPPKNPDKTASASIFGVHVYSAVLVLLMIVFCFSAGAAHCLDIAPFLLLFTMAILSPINCLTPTPVINKDFTPGGELLKRSEVPFIQSLADRTLQITETKEEIPLFLTLSASSGVYRKEKSFVFCLNPVEIVLLSEDELYALMLGYLAGNAATDVKKLDKWFLFSRKAFGRRHMPFFNASTFLFLSFYDRPLCMNRIMRANFWDTKRIDEEKLGMLSRHNEKENFIKASAKLRLYNLFRSYPWKETTYDYYEDPEPPRDSCQSEVKLFFEKFKIYGDRWSITLNHGLKGPGDTDPSFKGQLKLYGIKSVDTKTLFSKAPSKKDYVNDQTMLLKMGSALSLNEFDEDKKSYEELRESNYTFRNESIEKYENSIANWETLTDSELIECAQSYFYIDNDKMLSILNEVIERSGNSFALYVKAKLLALEYDDGCIDSFIRCANDSAGAEAAISELIGYAVKTGNRTLLKKIRNMILKKNSSIDEDFSQAMFSEENLAAANTGDKEVTDEVVRELKKYWKDALKGVYIATRTTDSGIKAFYIAVDVDVRQEDLDVEDANDHTEYFLARLSVADKKFFIFFSGKEFKKIKKLKHSCFYQNV